MPARSAVQPDKALVKDQLQALQAMLEAWGPKLFMAAMFWILAKTPQERLDPDAEGSVLVPFRLNPIQDDLDGKLVQNNICLKSRQSGFTTYFVLRRLFLPAITNPGTGAFFISQKNEYVERNFRIVKRAYNLIAAEDPADDSRNELCRALKEHMLHTAYSNRRELVFDQIHSNLVVESSEVEEAGQTMPLHHVVADEYARWPKNPEATLANVRGALGPGGTLDKISTANGAAGPFWKDCLLAMSDPEASDAKFHFYPPWWTPEYRISLNQKEQAELEKDLEATERKLVEMFHVELSYIAWRRVQKIAFRAEFDEKYPEDPQLAFLVAGRNYFDREVLIARKLELVRFKPFQTFGNGEARLFHPRVAGRRYVIGADVATGREVASEDTDFCAAVVLDLETGEEMAAYRAKVTPQDLAYDLADLGNYYNAAPVAVERTGDGSTTILTLQGECRYAGVMKFKEWWKRHRKIAEIEGFPTTPKTRPDALNRLNRFILEYPERIWDTQFIDEALSFVRDEKGIPKAAPGAHDDTVACRWIAHAARAYLLGFWDPVAVRPREGYISAERMTAGDVAGPVGWSPR